MITLTESQGVATIWLDRPSHRNAMTLAMWDGAGNLARSLATREDIHIVVLKGRHQQFCAGADIQEFPNQRFGRQSALDYDERLDACIRAVMRLPQPTIAAIQGACIGGGCALAAACDFRVADHTAVFGIPAVRIATVYSRLNCSNLVNLVGYSQACRILLSGLRFDLAEALAMGFVNACVPGTLERGLNEWCSALLAGAPRSVRVMKALLRSVGPQRPGEAEMDAAVEAMIASLRESADYHEGISAFLEKRPARFTGR